MTGAPQIVVPSGARWRRIDLHLHSPGVETFACPSGSDLTTDSGRRSLATAWADRLVAAGIEIGALTDYNGVRTTWYPLLNRAAEARDIMLLPGAEVSLKEGKGLHILVIFPCGCDPAEINEALRSLDRQPARALFDDGDRTKPHAELDLDKNLADALITLRQRFDCLVIPAHCADSKGLLKALGAQGAAELIGDAPIDALEHAAGVMDSLRATAILPAHRLANLACVEFSDPKRLEDIGAKALPDASTRGTWLKLSATDVDALRLALHDPQTRLTTTPPLAPAHARVISMAVDGSGFLGTMQLAFNEDLNTLVGGRGVGKSALLETLRYALRGKVYSEAEYRMENVRNALGSGGVVTVIVERPGSPSGTRYVIRRVLDLEPEVTDEKTGQTLGVPPLEVFGLDAEPIVLLQKEIQQVSADDSYRLQLLDVLVGEKAADAARKVTSTIGDLDANGRSLVDASTKLRRRVPLEERLRSIKKEVEFFRSQGVVSKVEAHTRLAADRAVIEGAKKSLENERVTWEEVVTDSEGRLADVEARLKAGKSSESQSLVDAADVVHGVADAVAQAGRLVASAIKAAAKGVGDLEARVETAAEPLDKELHRLRREAPSPELDPVGRQNAIRVRWAGMRGSGGRR